MLNESIVMLVDQAVTKLSILQISFGLKLVLIFGFIFILQTLKKTGFSIIEIFIYVYAFIKWVIFKIRGKDI